MFFSLESAQSSALCTALGTKTSTLGLNLPFSKIPRASFEQNKAFYILVAKTIQEGEPQGIKSPKQHSHCNLEFVSQPSVNTRDNPMALSCIICFSEHSWREYLRAEMNVYAIFSASLSVALRFPSTFYDNRFL